MTVRLSTIHTALFSSKHPNKISLDRHLAESDSVFRADAGKDGFHLLFVFGE